MRIALLATVTLGTAAAQAVLPARPGVVQFTEGPVFIENDSIRSGAEGRAEILLNACAVLHLDERAGLRLLSTRFDDMRVELLAGAVFVQADAILRDTKVTIVAGGVSTVIARPGVFRFDAMPPRMRVYAGRGAGREFLLTRQGGPHKFDPDLRADAFGRWQERRIAALSRASGQHAREDRQRRERAAQTESIERAWDESGGRAAAQARVSMTGLPTTGGGPDRVRICSPEIK